MSNSNIWDSFPKTDPQYTKGNNQGGRKSTSITPVYMVKLATDALGPIGKGWGYNVIEERFDDGAPIVLIQAANTENKLPVYMMDGGNIVYEKNHTVLLEMWIADSDKTYCQYGHTRYSYMTKNGKYYVDDEYGKKSITDAMTKCLSLLGVCSDVYMGEFDNGDYVQIAKLESDLAKADKSDSVYVEKLGEFRKYVKTQAVQIGLCPTVEAMQKVYTLVNGKIVREAPLLGLDVEEERSAIDAAYNENKEKIGE